MCYKFLFEKPLPQRWLGFVDVEGVSVLFVLLNRVGELGRFREKSWSPDLEPEAMACEELSQRLAGRKQEQIESIVIEEAATTALEAAQEPAMAQDVRLTGGPQNYKTIQNQYRNDMCIIAD